MKTPPITLPDGIYIKAEEPRLGTISQHAERAVAVANERGKAWLIFNGTSIEIIAGAQLDDVVRCWFSHRENYQRDADG